MCLTNEKIKYFPLLQAHKRLPTAEKPVFRYRLCTSACGRSYDLKRYYRNVHKLIVDNKDCIDDNVLRESAGRTLSVSATKGMQPRGKQRLGQLSAFGQRSFVTAETTRSRQQASELFDEQNDDDVDSTTSEEQQSVDSDDDDDVDWTTSEEQESVDSDDDDDVDSTTSEEQESVDSDDGNRDEANASRAPKGAQPTNVVHARKRKSKRHVCRYCRVVFPSKWEVDRHVRYRHTQEKPYKCTLCDFDCVERCKLSLHMKQHVGHPELFDGMPFSNVLFDVRGKCFRAHKNILAAGSAVFAAMFIKTANMGLYPVPSSFKMWILTCFKHYFALSTCGA
jgi:hypothetical protein